MGNVCGCGKTLQCEGTSAGYKGQGETRLTGLPPSTAGTCHEGICSSGFLLPQGNIQPNHVLPHWQKLFGGFPFLDFLIGLFFLMMFFFLLRRNEAIPIIIL